MARAALPPIIRSVTVKLDQEAAFERFTKEFGAWWPTEKFSIGGLQVKRVVFETFPGGQIFEERADGSRVQWGWVELWEPPTRVRFKWHPSRDADTAQDVELEFVPDGTGTRVELTATGWERWGEGAAEGHKTYRQGWSDLLAIFADRAQPE